MLEKGKILESQFTLFVITFSIGSSILVAPSGLAQAAKQDGWIAETIALLIGLTFVWLYNQLASAFPNQTLTQYSELILGKWLGRIVSYSYFIYLLIFSAQLLREIGDFLTTQILPHTPIESIHIIFLIIVMMATRLGLETFVRANEIFFPWIIGLFLILVLSVTPQIKIENLQPIFENGIKPILKGVYPTLSLPYLELSVFLMIFPYVNKTEKIKRSFYIGTVIAGMILITISIVSISIMGAETTARQIYPSYILAKKISIAHFFERVEAIMAGIWFITIFFKLTLCFYAFTLGLAQTLQLKDYRILTYPLGIITFTLSIIGDPNITYFQRFMNQAWTPYSLTYGFFLPILLLTVALIRKK